MVDFHDPIKGNETWVLSATGAMRLDDYRRLNDTSHRAAETLTGTAISTLNPNDFLTIKEIARGGGGCVVKALHKPTMSLVAVKKMKISSAAKRNAMRMELRVLYCQLKNLKEPREFSIGEGEEKVCDEIVGFYDAYSTEDGFIHIMMEYLNGGSLQELIETSRTKETAVPTAVSTAGPKETPPTLDARVLMSMAIGITNGLAFLHNKKMMHRDVKPGNVLMNVDGTVKLTDFGVARDMASSSNKAETFVGTFLYMSPERIKGEEYDQSADVWGLGMTLCATALGRYPIEIKGKDAYWEIYERLVAQKRNRLVEGMQGMGFDKQFLDFLDCCLAKNPRDRWTIKALLTHPFVKEGTVTRSATMGGMERVELNPIERKTTMAQNQEISLLTEAREAELCEIVAVCNEAGIMYSRKDDLCNFERLALQLGLPSEAVRDKFCPRRPRGSSPKRMTRPSFAQRISTFARSPSNRASQMMGAIAKSPSNLGSLFRRQNSGGEEVSESRRRRAQTLTAMTGADDEGGSS